MSHLDEGILHGLVDGEIPSHALGPIQAHLAACAECRSRLEAERALASDAMDLIELIEVPAPEEPVRRAGGPARGRRSPWLGLAWAASVIGAVGLGYAARGTRGPPATAPLASMPPLRDAAATAESTARPGRTAPATGTAAAPRRSGPTRAAPLPPEPKTLASANPDTGQPRRAEETRAAPVADQRIAAVPPVRQEKGGSVALNLSPAIPPPVAFPVALQQLNGTIRLIPGMIPSRLEVLGSAVRVIYPVAEGELVLQQELVDGKLVFQLIAPRGFPADSLERLRARVRE